VGEGEGVGEAVGVDVGLVVDVGGRVAVDVALLLIENVAVGATVAVFGLGSVQASKMMTTDTDNMVCSVRLFIQPSPR
jgi:hypothetical protein